MVNKANMTTFTKWLIIGFSFCCTNAFSADIVFMRGSPERLAGHVGAIPDNSKISISSSFKILTASS